MLPSVSGDPEVDRKTIGPPTPPPPKANLVQRIAEPLDFRLFILLLDLLRIPLSKRHADVPAPSPVFLFNVFQRPTAFSMYLNVASSATFTIRKLFPVAQTPSQYSGPHLDIVHSHRNLVLVNSVHGAFDTCAGCGAIA